MSEGVVKADTASTRRSSLAYDYWLMSRRRRSSVRSIIDSIMGNVANDTLTGKPAKSSTSRSLSRPVTARKEPRPRESQNRSPIVDNESEVGVPAEVFEKRKSEDLESNPPRRQTEQKRKCCLRRMSLPCVMSALRKSPVPPKLVSRALSSSAAVDGGMTRAGVQAHPRKSSWTMISKVPMDRTRHRRREANERSVQQDRDKISSPSGTDHSLRSMDSGDRFEPVLASSPKLSTRPVGINGQGRRQRPSTDAGLDSRALAVNHGDSPPLSNPLLNTGVSAGHSSRSYHTDRDYLASKESARALRTGRYDSDYNQRVTGSSRNETGALSHIVQKPATSSIEEIERKSKWRYCSDYRSTDEKSPRNDTNTISRCTSISSEPTTSRTQRRRSKGINSTLAIDLESESTTGLEPPAGRSRTREPYRPVDLANVTKGQSDTSGSAACPSKTTDTSSVPAKSGRDTASSERSNTMTVVGRDTRVSRGREDVTCRERYIASNGRDDAEQIGRTLPSPEWDLDLETPECDLPTRSRSKRNKTSSTGDTTAQSKSNSSPPPPLPTTGHGDCRTTTIRPGTSAWSTVGVAGRLRWLEGERGANQSTTTTTTAPTTATATTTAAAAAAATAVSTQTCITHSHHQPDGPVTLPGLTPHSQEARPGQRYSSKDKSVIPDHLRRRIRSEDLTTVKSFWRYKTQPPELTAEEKSDPFQDAETAPRRKFKYEGRHMTQPITPDEMREAEATTPAPGLARTPGGSIADRLNQLKTSGEEEWKRRVGKKDDLIMAPDVVVKLREKPVDGVTRPTSIADRLSQIETAKSTWRGRVEETDAKRFTVAGKLANNAVDSPLVQKLKNLPKTEEPSSTGTSPLASPSTPTKESIAKIPIPKEIIHDPTVTIETVKPKPTPVEDEEEVAPPVLVEVPSIGEEMESFFSVKAIDEIQDTVEVTADDFDNIFIEANDILPTVRKLRPQRKTKARSLNPLKTMSQRLDIKQEYTQVQLGTAEKEFKRMKKENLARDAGFAQAALAGLASKENFKKVELRRSDSASLAHGQRLDPFSDLMLLHVKGRRMVQTRLVEPHGRSINSGDCYILVTPEKIIQWEGQFANVIEKAKASEIAGYILQKKDLGCKKCSEVQTVTQARDHLGAGKAFWAALEGDKQSQAAGPDNEDELYENSVTRSNMIYRLEGNALLPYEEYWGVTPKHAMLKRNEVVVFDFGPEFYIWQGKGVTMEQRKLGMKLAKQLFDKGYDYSMSAVSPFSPLRTEEDGGLPTQASKRPKWTIFGKVNQNMETILFREKFSDWPDSSRLIGVKGQDSTENSQKETPAELKPFDATQMLPLNTAPVSLKLDGAHVGRGVKWSEDMQGFIKTQEIVTLEVTVWHVLEYEHCKLPALSRGQFHEGDTYVVRWQYMITNANLRSLKGSAARNSLTGRERCAYFFWQGNSSTINEKGASALMTVELDEERGPQVRVLQGKEPPCFLNLFGGSMIVHVGKREDPDTNTKGAWRLYCVRGDYENEICLQEIPVSIEHLRSRSSLFLLNVKTGLMYIWHGAKSPPHIRECCQKVVERLKENTPLELSLHKGATLTAVEVNEGEEKSEIWSAFDSRDRKSYCSLLTDPLSSRHTLRLFHMSSVNMTFEVHEQLNPSRVHDLPSPFPFLQADLYKSSQPALFMLDNHHAVYLWQGWWPVGSYDSENVHTGSATARFNMDRRCAMETVLHYCRVKDPSSPPPAYLICAGVEPKHFTSLFPFWEEDTVVKDIALEEGRSEGYQEKLEEVLHRITQTRYTLAQLQERPLPEGVDPLRLEAYLDDEEFMDILEMDKEEFYQMPAWKQKVEKQRVGLY